jgi:hypothetical protein
MFSTVIVDISCWLLLITIWPPDLTGDHFNYTPARQANRRARATPRISFIGGLALIRVFGG